MRKVYIGVVTLMSLGIKRRKSQTSKRQNFFSKISKKKFPKNFKKGENFQIFKGRKS